MPEVRDQIVVNENGIFIPHQVLGQRKRILEVLNRLGAFSEQPEIASAKSFQQAEPIDCSREIEWISQHREEYLGQWVALSGSQLISHGTNALEVANAARVAGVEIPFLAQIDPVEDLPFGGW